MKFLFKMPSKGRPEIFKKNISRWISYLSGEHEYLFVFTFNEDDDTMNNDEIKKFVDELPVNKEYYYGDVKNKIEAVNANIDDKDFDILFLLIDDLEPTFPKFDKITAEIFENNPNKLDSVINFRCTRWHFSLLCFPVMGKTYYDRFGYINHPGYKSLGADNDFTYVAKLLGKEICEDRSVFFHNYIIGDTTELENRAKQWDDFEYFYARKRRNFDLGETEIKIEDLDLFY